MDPHSTSEVELPNATSQKILLYNLRWIQLHQISLQSQTHQRPCQYHSPQIDYKHYYKCREPIHFVNAFPIIYQMAKYQNMKLVFFYTSFLALGIPKAWKYTVLMQAHDKLGHQGATCTYCLIQCHYYWKGMNKDIMKYIANCTLCHREKAKVQSYCLQMTEILE